MIRRLTLALAAVLTLVATAPAASARPALDDRPPPPWDACRYDDGSNAPCVWDARHMGDGLGTSFKALPRRPDCRGPRCADPRIVHITHRRAHFLLGWAP